MVSGLMVTIPFVQCMHDCTWILQPNDIMQVSQLMYSCILGCYLWKSKYSNYQTPYQYALAFKACVCYFRSNFCFSPNDSPSKTMKNVFCFI